MVFQKLFTAHALVQYRERCLPPGLTDATGGQGAAELADALASPL